MGAGPGFIRCFMMIYWPPHATLHSFWHSRGWSGLYRVIKAVIPSAAMVVIAYRMRRRRCVSMATVTTGAWRGIDTLRDGNKS